MTLEQTDNRSQEYREMLASVLEEQSQKALEEIKRMPIGSEDKAFKITLRLAMLDFMSAHNKAEKELDAKHFTT